MVDATDVSPEIFSTQPFVRVGNILGNRADNDDAVVGLQHYNQDTIERKFTITDGDDDGGIVYEGESNKVFKVEFVANGPMYTIIGRGWYHRYGRRTSINSRNNSGWTYPNFSQMN